MKNFKLLTLATISSLVLFNCSDDDNGTSEPIVIVDPVETITKASVMENYAAIVLENYQDAYDDAVLMRDAISTFTTTPNQANFDAAKTAWLNARESYGPSEAFRFADGPIDNSDDAPEGLLNSWPLDEAYVDYVVDPGTVGGILEGGLINDTSFAISKASLEGKNQESGNEAEVSVGYHAIEFLLWGQDSASPAVNSAGQRAYTDYVDGGTNANQDRRRAYINACAELILDHLQLLINDWSVTGAYRTTFLAMNEDTAIGNIIGSISEMAKSELAVERMFVALDNMDQEDEHSCFSDNTHRDIRLNWDGIKNVYQGSYGSINGASIKDLITQENPTVGATLDTVLATTETTVNNTGIPFDVAISGGVSSVEGQKVATAVASLQSFGDELVVGASVLGITIN